MEERILMVQKVMTTSNAIKLSAKIQKTAKARKLFHDIEIEVDEIDHNQSSVRIFKVKGNKDVS